ncbi:MAG: class III signal peptide-containing protein [Methanobacteriaceae archaeon]|nr:class III signal peptide-containing protein [Methanobacteriaceae archaeon]
MRFMDEKRGQGGAEYILLFGAVIFIAIASLGIYKAYFTPINGTDASLEITNTGSGAVNVMYEVRNTNVPDRVNKSSPKTTFIVPDGKEQDKYTNLKKGETIKVPVGGLKKGDVIYVEVGVQQSSGSVLVKFTQGSKSETWTVKGPFKPYAGTKAEDYMNSGAVIRSITITEGSSGLKASSDIESMRGKI